PAEMRSLPRRSPLSMHSARRPRRRLSPPGPRNPAKRLRLNLPGRSMIPFLGRRPVDISMALAHGLHLLPVQPRGKIPLIADWPNRATSDPAIVQLWHDEHPGCNWGIVTGIKSGVVVLDVDARHAGEETLAQLQQQYDALPLTWEVLTGGGGRHLY